MARRRRKREDQLRALGISHHSVAHPFRHGAAVVGRAGGLRLSEATKLLGAHSCCVGKVSTVGKVAAATKVTAKERIAATESVRLVTTKAAVRLRMHRSLRGTLAGVSEEAEFIAVHVLKEIVKIEAKVVTTAKAAVVSWVRLLLPMEVLLMLVVTATVVGEVGRVLLKLVIELSEEIVEVKLSSAEAVISAAMSSTAVRLEGLVAEHVVLLPFILVRKYVVGLGNLSEAVHGVLLFVFVGMVLQGKLTEGLLDLPVLRRPLETKKLVVVLLLVGRHDGKSHRLQADRQADQIQ